jgi:hypothetical protein
MVPPQIAEMIKGRRLFGYQNVEAIDEVQDERPTRAA